MRVFLYVPRCLIVMLFAVCFFAGPVSAQEALSQCNSLNRSNVDCACVSKRIDAYKARAATSAQQRYIIEGYKLALGSENDFEGAALASSQSDQQRLEMSFQFNGVGGVPQNIEDYEKGCLIAGAPLTPLPNYTPGPVKEEWINYCMTSVGDLRSCHCSLATMDRRLSDTQFRYLFASYSDYSSGPALSREERYVYLANTYGTSPDTFKQVEAEARAITQNYRDQDEGLCGALLWPDQRPGRSAEARAGTPVGFENPGGVTSLAEIMKEQEEAAAFARSQAAGQDAENAAAMAQGAAQNEAFEQQLADSKVKGQALNAQSDPKALLEKSCVNDDNDQSYCSCLGTIFDDIVQSSGAGDGVATQLALLMSGGGLDDMDTQAMMQGATAQDLTQAGQLFGMNMMKLMSCQ